MLSTRLWSHRTLSKYMMAIWRTLSELTLNDWIGGQSAWLTPPLNTTFLSTWAEVPEWLQIPWASHIESTMESIGWISLEVGKSHHCPYWGADRIRATSAIRMEGESWQKTQRRDHSLFGLGSPLSMLLKGKLSDISRKDTGNGKNFQKGLEKDCPQGWSPLPWVRTLKGRWFTCFHTLLGL